ncbi:MAG: response regulator transcription factor [Anaerolineae bacterium]|nr:response regulator transcription factor [Anaerolineae bacterium]
MAGITADLFDQLSLTPTTMSTEKTLSDPAGTLVEPLTPREFDVLQLLCKGQTNGEIADELGIAGGTVKFYTSQIYGKLGARNRVTAVARAHELNLIPTG